MGSRVHDGDDPLRMIIGQDRKSPTPDTQAQLQYQGFDYSREELDVAWSIDHVLRRPSAGALKQKPFLQ